ncbi:MAG TPA: calcium-binding protein [Ramlibacter sp.]|nr:calcium-binding protein [Ramlibacter sp.]
MNYQQWGSTLPVDHDESAADAVVSGIGFGRFVVVWSDSARTGEDSTSGTAVRMKVYDPFGVALTPIPLVVNSTASGNQARPQVVALENGEFVVAWEDSSHELGSDASGTAIRAQRFDAGGNRMGTEILLNSTTMGDQLGVALARNGSGFVAAWADNSGEAPVIRAQRFDSVINPLGSEFLVGSSASGIQSPVQATDTDAGFALAWRRDNGSIQVQTFTASAAVLGPASTITAPSWNYLLDGPLDLARINQAGDFVLEYRLEETAPMWPGTQNERFYLLPLSSDGQPQGEIRSVYSAYLSNFWIDGAWHNYATPRLQTEGLAGWNTITAAAGGAFFAGAADATMLQDGRMVTVSASGGVAFTMYDGRGSNFGAVYATGPTILVGADAGPDMNNVITGSAFFDTMHGLGGNDYLYGYGGNDALMGGLGSDVLLADDGDDTLAGEDGDDHLFGGIGANVLRGGSGVDVLITDARAVADTVHGGDGGDYIYSYAVRGTTVAYGDAGNDIFVMQQAPAIAHGGDGQDYFYMGMSADLMMGGEGVDVMLGGGGEDTYDGGAGTDYLFLGSGRDTLVVNLQSGVDVVNDFGPSQDVLQLQGTGLTSLSQLLAATTDYGSYSIITIDANTAVWLIGLTPVQFKAESFQFS